MVQGIILLPDFEEGFDFGFNFNFHKNLGIVQLNFLCLQSLCWFKLVMVKIRVQIINSKTLHSYFWRKSWNPNLRFAFVGYCLNLARTCSYFFILSLLRPRKVQTIAHNCLTNEITALKNK